MSILFDALKRDQETDTKTEQEGIDLIMDLSEPAPEVEIKAEGQIEPNDSKSDTDPSEPVAVPPPAPEPVENIPPKNAGMQAAQSIFSATKRPSRQVRLAVGGLIILLLAGSGGLWYYLQTMTSLVSQPAIVITPYADSPVDADTLSQQSETPPSSETPGQANAEQHAAETVPSPLPPSTSPPENEPAQATELAVAEVNNKNPAIQAQQTPPEKGVLAPNKEKTASENLVPLKTNTDSEKRPPITQAPPKKISPRHQNKPPQPQKTDTQSHPIVDDLPETNAGVTASGDPLREGYQALAEGRLDDAERLYLEVISKRPHERDALLGLAVVSHRQLHTERASELYRQVLREDPGNATATAALITLSVQINPVAAESHLKLLLDQNSTSPELHHALGSVLARQKRWGEAQQEFFRAYSLEPNNALYAYNLAVALDHLRKPAAALPYYEKSAQNLHSDNTATYRDAIEQRVQELRSSLPEQR